MKKKAPINFLSLRVQLALVIVLVEVLFIDKLASAGIEFVLSSVVVTVALLIQLRFGIRPAAAAPADSVVFVFNWLFLDLAPKVQLISMPRQLINTSSVSVDGVALTNLVCALFMIAFTLFYVFLSRRPQNPPGRAAAAESPREFSAGAVGLAVLVCVLVVAVAAPRAYAQVENSVAATPALLLIMLQKWFAAGSRRLLLLVGGMVVIFPAIAIFTHNKSQTISTVSLQQFTDQISDHYFSINYDSWANIYTAVEIVKVHGMQWGHQLLGSVLFFVPSSLWSCKPLATGIFLADYLIRNYSMWFTNLSAPLVAEGYLDFGPGGVLAYAAAMAWLVVLLNRIAERGANWIALPVAIYTSVFLMIVLRGSLMIALGFAAAALLSFLFAYALLSVRWGARRHIAGRRYAVHRLTQ